MSSDPPPQDVLETEGLLGQEKHRAVPAGTADQVIEKRKRQARRWALRRALGAVIAGIIVAAVVFRFVDDLAIAGGIGLAIAVVGSVAQVFSLDEGVPEVVATEVEPHEVQAEYGVEPVESVEEIL